jgi:hypothetical protein
MDIHSAVLDEMVFCRNVNSFLTYLANLMTLIYEKYPKKLPSNKQGFTTKPGFGPSSL